MARQPHLYEIDNVEKLFRQVGSTVTIGVQPTDRYLGGELWTVHTRVGGQLGIGQGGTLADAFQDLHAVPLPAEAAAA